jgi:hypothetical protein
MGKEGIVLLISIENICRIQESYVSSTVEENKPLNLPESSISIMSKVTPYDGYQDAIRCT